MRTNPSLIAALLLVLTACSSPTPPTTDAAPATDAAPPADDTDGESLAGVGDAPDASDSEVGDPLPTPPEYDPAPWSNAKLAAAVVPSFYLQQWQRADNRATCAPVAPADLGDHGGAKPRAANFSGGWAVAYDEPGLRSAFGIAGAGITAGGDTYDWENDIAWADGSHAGYGLEGGTGPKFLAYLQIAGQECLYNVWSQHGEAHLVQLLESLRFIEAPPPAP